MSGTSPRHRAYTVRQSPFQLLGAMALTIGIGLTLMGLPAVSETVTKLKSIGNPKPSTPMELTVNVQQPSEVHTTTEAPTQQPDKSTAASVDTPAPSPVPNLAEQLEEEAVAELKKNWREPRKDEGTPFNTLDPKTHHWFLGVCASTAMSSGWLREWLEIQLLGGVDHVWIVNDNKPGEDPLTAQILKIYEQRGFVTVIPGRHPDPPFDGCTGMWVEPDCITPKYCHDHVSPYVDRWIFADTDEFIFPRMGCDLGHHLKHNCDPNAAYEFLHWERFGTSGHHYMPKGLMTENFLTSGADCMSEKHGDRRCDRMFYKCYECQHTKVLYNTQCTMRQHVGWIHDPVNTSDWKVERRHQKKLPMESHNNSVFKHEACTEMNLRKTSDSCTEWSQRGGGSNYPPIPSADCCSAGVGYNHYGSKSKSKYLEKMDATLRRGFKAEFDRIDTNHVLSMDMLRFVRALRQRYVLQGLPVSDDVSFLDPSPERSCFAEDNYRYTADPRFGGEELKGGNGSSSTSCCDACWGKAALPSGRCSAWAFDKVKNVCQLFFAPRNSFFDGEDLKKLRWPHATVPVERERNTRFMSGVVLHEGECPMPRRLQQDPGGAKRLMKQLRAIPVGKAEDDKTKDSDDEGATPVLWKGLPKSYAELDARHHWDLSVCGSVAKETGAQELREWLEGLVVSGMGHVWLVGGYPSEEVQGVVAEYIQKGLVTELGAVQVEEGWGPRCGARCAAAKTCHKLVSKFTDWWVQVDTNEVLYPTMGCNLGAELGAHCDDDAAYHVVLRERRAAKGHGGLFAYNTCEDKLLPKPSKSRRKQKNRVYCEPLRPCGECREVTLVYNTMCVTVDQVGVPVEELEGAGSRKGLNDPRCKKKSMQNVVQQCQYWANFERGAKRPPVPGKQCCTAGFTLQGTEVSFNVSKVSGSTGRTGMALEPGQLKFRRALWDRLGEAHTRKAEGERFIDSGKGTCYVVNGRLAPEEGAGATVEVLSGAFEIEDCCARCASHLELEKYCAGWTHSVKDNICSLLMAPYSEKREKPMSKWPQDMVPASVEASMTHTSGVVLRQGECGVPKGLEN